MTTKIRTRRDIKQFSLIVMSGVMGMSISLPQKLQNPGIAACPPITVPPVVRPAQTVAPPITVPPVVRPTQTVAPPITVPPVVRPAQTVPPPIC